MSWKDIFPKENRYFETENGILYYGDCLDILKQMPENSIDCAVTSPPYFNSFHKYQRRNGYHYTSDIGEPLYVVIDMFDILKGIIKDNSPICLNLGFSYGETGVMRPFDIVNRLRNKLGYFVCDVIIWHKHNPIPIKNRLTNAFEYIFVLSKTPFVEYNVTKYTHNVWKFPVDTGSKGTAVFPIQLPLNCVQYFSKENSLVLDPFLGSGTTAVACERLNRRWIGIELNPDYCEIAKQRILGEI